MPMKRPLLLIPLLALAAVPCLAQDPATASQCAGAPDAPDLADHHGNKELHRAFGHKSVARMP